MKHISAAGKENNLSNNFPGGSNSSVIDSAILSGTIDNVELRSVGFIDYSGKKQLIEPFVASLSNTNNIETENLGGSNIQELDTELYSFETDVIQNISGTDGKLKLYIIKEFNHIFI